MTKRHLIFANPGRLEIYCHHSPAATYPEKDHRTVQIFVPLEGAVYTVTRRSETGLPLTHNLGARDVLVIPADQPHDVAWRRPANVVSLQLSEDFIAEALDTQSFRLSDSFIVRDAFTSAAAVQIRAAFRVEGKITPTFAQAMAIVIAYRIGAPVVEGRVRASENVGGLSAHQLVRIDRFVDEHLDQPITLDALAALVGISKWHFMRRFSASRGLSPHGFITQRRYERAQMLLAETQLSIIAIALDVGMSHSHFSRTFLSRFGVSPREYRRLRSS